MINMIIQSPGEIAFSLFDLPVFWYGIIIAFAVFVGVLTAEMLARRQNFPAGFFVDNSPLIIVLGLLGARLYYCLLNFEYYLANPILILDIRQGGLSIHGMLFAGFIIIYYFVKKYQVGFLKMADILACSVSISQSIGRWGNFFNSEAFGLPTYSTWGLYIPVNNRPAEYVNYELFHPAFLYESILNLIIFIVLIFVLKNTKKHGVVFALYLILYSLTRFFVEQIRLDSALNIFGVPVAQYVSVFLIILGVLLFIYIDKKSD